MKIEIKNRWTGEVIFSLETDSFRAAAESGKANLRGANLRGANMSDADMRGADMRGADMRGADMRDADMRDANLRGANLRGANMRGANLCGANLRGANMSDADMRGADMRGADMRDADMRDADMRGANLRGAKNIPESYKRMCRDDLWAVLSAAPMEVDGLRKALAEGRVDGSTYSGECACLIGTIANVRGKAYNDLGLLKPESSRPIERFFTAINRGDTPETNEWSKLALSWCDEWLGNMRAAFGQQAGQS